MYIKEIYRMKYVRYHEKSAARVERENIKEIDVFKIILSHCTLHLRKDRKYYLRKA